MVIGSVMGPHEIMMYCRVKLCPYPSTASSRVTSVEVTSGARAASYDSSQILVYCSEVEK